MLALMQRITSQDATGGNSKPQGPPADLSDAIFARRLRAVREAAGMTQQHLADAMASTGNKIHRSTIGKIESGDRPVTVGEAIELAGILGVDLAGLVTSPGPLTVEQARQQRAYRARVEAQAKVRGLQHEAGQRQQDLQVAQARYEDVRGRLAEAQHHLAGLGGEMSPAKSGGEDDR